MTPAGFPHSGTPGSKLSCSSPGRFAAYAPFIGHLSQGIHHVPFVASQQVTRRCVVPLLPDTTVKEPNQRPQPPSRDSRQECRIPNASTLVKTSESLSATFYASSSRNDRALPLRHRAEPRTFARVTFAGAANRCVHILSMSALAQHLPSGSWASGTRVVRFQQHYSLPQWNVLMAASIPRKDPVHLSNDPLLPRSQLDHVALAGKLFRPAVFEQHLLASRFLDKPNVHPASPLALARLCTLFYTFGLGFGVLVLGGPLDSGATEATRSSAGRPSTAGRGAAHGCSQRWPGACSRRLSPRFRSQGQEWTAVRRPDSGHPP